MLKIEESIKATKQETEALKTEKRVFHVAKRNPLSFLLKLKL